MKTKLPLLLLCLSLIAGCKDDEPQTTVPTALIYSYNPTNVGHELVYDVSLITKDEFTQQHDTLIYQLKEIIESTFLDAQGRPTQRLERYTRILPSDPWVIDQVWTSNLTANHVERKEENIVYVKMVFPILSSITWNGNVYNTNDPMTYGYQDLHLPASVGTLSFDSTLTVVQQDEDTFIDYNYNIEKFAKHVGLIYRENIYVLKDNSLPGGVPGIIAQRKYKQTLISFVN